MLNIYAIKSNNSDLSQSKRFNMIKVISLEKNILMLQQLLNMTNISPSLNDWD